MADTQWPRYQVFVQEKEGSPHIDAGSIHAPDPEMAILNARDVFARRPQCVSMWVVPVECIYSRTAQELEDQEKGAEEGEIQDTGEEAYPYLVFNKARPAGTQTYYRKLEARSPAEALLQVLKEHQGRRPVFAWWVVPESQVARTDPDDVDSLFAPALDKPFRLSTDFRVVSAMQKIRSRQAGP